MKSLNFHVGAEEELREIQRYYEAKQPGSGMQWLKTVDEAARQMQKKSPPPGDLRVSERVNTA